jgi:hypothetical protein
MRQTRLGGFVLISLQQLILFIWLQMADFKSVSPVASYLFCFAKISNQQKATPDRSKARKFVSILRHQRKLAIC